MVDTIQNRLDKCQQSYSKLLVQYDSVVEKNQRLGHYIQDLEEFVKQHSGYVPPALLTQHKGY